MAETKGVCIVCGRIFEIRTTSAGKDGSYRRGWCGCNKDEVTQSNMEDKLLDKNRGIR